jgi:hypothetical protein
LLAPRPVGGSFPEGCGVLKTARLVAVHPDIVSHYSRIAGER